MPLTPNEAGRLRGMIARLITTKGQMDIASAERDFTGNDHLNVAKATTSYKKAKEKLNNYISTLERTGEKV